MAALLLSGCESPAPKPAPVVDRVPETARKPQRKPGGVDTRPEYYTVKRGDTLYGIALDQGLDYRELAAWNGLTEMNRITIGQQLRLRPPGAASPPPAGAAPADAAEVVTAPLPAPTAAEGKPLGAETPKAAPPASRPADAGSPAVASTATLVKGPKAQRLPYSEEALAQMKAAPSPFASAGVIAAAAAATTRPPKADALPVKPEPPKMETAKVEPRPDASPEPQAGDEEDRVDWSWPSNGKIVSPFTEGSNLKGIGVGGKAGQPVLASAAGKVVYAGSGLRGYGKLVIIKHNKTYLSVYAHNSEILVKEGQAVSKGQKIAEMGNTDADQVKLHFEIRRLGKPVDPLKYLPAAKS
jgi:lipoprotein NlpD